MASQFKLFHNCALGSIELRLITVVSLVVFIIRVNCVVVIALATLVVGWLFDIGVVRSSRAIWSVVVGIAGVVILATR